MYSTYNHNATANRIRGWPHKNTGADPVAQKGVAAPWLIELDSRLLAKTLWQYVLLLSRPILDLSFTSPISQNSVHDISQSLIRKIQKYSSNFVKVVPEGVILRS